MSSIYQRVARRVVALREGEGATTALMFAYSFLAMTAYNVLKPVTRSQVIDSFGADNLPYVQLAAGLVIGGLMQAYARLGDYVPSRWLIPLAQGGEVVLLVLFWLLFLGDAAWVSVAFYVFGLVMGVLLISQFWTLANDVYDPRQAKRLFGFIGGGASLGGATGAGLTALIVDRVGTDNLLLVGAALLACCTVIVAKITGRHLTAGGSVLAGVRGVHGGEAIRLLRSSRHLQLIALVIGAAAIGAAIIDQQLNMAAASIAGAGATDVITGFLATVTFYVSVIGVVIQLAFTSRIHRHLGLGIALLILPIGLGVTAGIVLVSGAIWAPGVARALDASLRYTVDKTTREVLFLPLPTALKHRVKPFIDVTVDRIARALGALLLLVLIKPWGLGLGWRELSYASLCVVGAWVVLALVVRREYLATFRRGLGDRTIAPAPALLDAADGATIETLVEELASADEDAVIHAIELLEALGKLNLVTPLLLHHESANVRARALAAIEGASAEVRARWGPALARLLTHEDPALRAAAVRALALADTGSDLVTMRPFLNDPDPRIAVTAATVLTRAGTDEDVRQAEKLLVRLAADTRPDAAPARREVASALRRLERPELRSILVPLMLDPDVLVAREAIRAVRAKGVRDPAFVPGLVSLLGHRQLKRDAREALLSFGDGVIDDLAALLRDPSHPPWVRRQVPDTLARLPAQASMDALVSALGDADGFVRYKALEGIEGLHRQNADLVFDRKTIDDRIDQETERYFTCLIRGTNLIHQRAAAADALITSTLDGKMIRIVDRVYRLLGLLYRPNDIAAARFTLEHGDARERASAVEYLDNLLTGSARRRVVPMVEDAGPEEKIRRAYAILGTHPRPLEDTLALLIRDDDPLVSAAAILFVAHQRLEHLLPDVESVLARRSAADGDVTDVAAWTLGIGRLPSGAQMPPVSTLPVAEVVDRLRRLPLFEFVSVDELFRTAALGRQVLYEKDRVLDRSKVAAYFLRFLLAGSVRLLEAGTAHTVTAPAALRAEIALEGRALKRVVRATTDVVCLEIDTLQFVSMLGDSVPLAQGVFRMLLAGTDERQWDALVGTAGVGGRTRRTRSLQPLDQVFLFRQHPVFSRATVEQLLGLVAIVRQLSVAAGTTLFGENDPLALYVVVEGQVRLERNGAEPVLVEAGRTIGSIEVLTGQSRGWRATVTANAQVLRLPAGGLFQLLTDHLDLLQSLFSGVIGAVRSMRR